MHKSILTSSAILATSNINRPRPSKFFLPGLTSTPVWLHSHQSTDTFPFVEYLLMSRDAINAELESNRLLLTNDQQVSEHENMFHQVSWDWYSYVQKGQRNEALLQAMPVTYSILSAMPVMMNIPISYCFISKLRLGSDFDLQSKKHVLIKEHSGICNLRLRVHVPLTDNRNYYLQVGNETISWDQNKVLIFDDSFPHQVVQHNENGDVKESERERLILLMDIWHPEVRDYEIKEIEEMFSSVMKVSKDKL